MDWLSSKETQTRASRWERVVRLVFRAGVCVAAATAIAGLEYRARETPTTAALSLLVPVLIVAAVWEIPYAIFLSVISDLALDYFFLPPIGSFTLTDRREWLALAMFLLAGVVASQLADRVRKEARNAHQRRADAVAEQQRFSDLVNSVEGIVWEADAQSLAFSFVSEEARRILGYPPDQWLREPAFWKDHLHPEDREWAVQFCIRATSEKRSHDFEYRMIAADGRVVWLRDLVTVVVEKGRPRRLRGVMIDITRRKQDEALLREQANLLTLTHDAIFVREMNATIKYWNRAAEEMYGWTAGEALGKSSHHFLKTAFPIPLEQIEETLMDTGRWEGELLHTRKDGTLLVAASRWSLQRDENGTPVAILETNNDITGHKRAEEAREELEEQWKAAFESNPTMYFIVDEAGGIVSVNPYGAEQLGYTVSEIVGQDVLNVFYEPDREAVRGHARACFEQPGRMMRWEARKIRKDGSMLWVRETANAVFLKKRLVLLVVCEDISEQKRAEDAVRRSERELRDAIESIPAMVFVALPGPFNVFASRGWREYTGLSSEDTAGFGWQSPIHPDDRARYMEKWRACTATGEPFEDEARFRHARDGEYRWFLVRAVSLRDQQGGIAKWYGILTDIEDRKRAEEALRRSETYLAEAQRLSQSGSWVFRPGSAKAIYWSEEMYRMWGFDPQQGPPDLQATLQRVHPEDRERLRLLFERAFEGRLSDDVVADHRILLPDGTLKYVHGISRPIFDESGRVVEYIGTGLDVTERKNAERALRESEELKRGIIESSKDCIKVLDLEANLLFMSSGGQHLLEIDNIQPYLNSCWINFWQPESRPKIAEAIAAARAGGIGRFQAFCPSAKGAPRWWDVIITPIFSADGQPEQLLSVSRDITEDKRAEAERERLRQLETDLAHMNRVSMMGELAASLAHEIKQPITAAATNARTCLRWLQREPPAIGEACATASRIVQDVRRAADIIDRNRSLYARDTPRPAPLDMNELVREMIVLLQDAANRYNVWVGAELEGSLPMITADRVQLQQVLMNLMLNGIEAMHDTGGELTVRSKQAEDGQIVLSVSDSGTGLPVENADRIFEAFFTTKAHGTGMGLSISRRIIESHGGRLWASTNAARGATFHFTLPLDPPPSALPRTETTPRVPEA